MSIQFDFFGQPIECKPAAARSVTAVAPRSWHLADHACRTCFGRVLKRVVGGKTVEVRCAECGVSAAGSHTAICCCGAEVGTRGKMLECYRNPNMTKAIPQEILIREKLAVKEAREVRRSNPVSIKGY